MQELDFLLDGESARVNGIQLQRALSFSAITPRMTTVQVVGKSGDLHIDHNAFDNVTATASCFALSENVNAQMADILAFLYGKRGYRKLQTNDDPMHYREAVVTNAGDIAARIALLNPFSIEFSCKPFRRLLSGDDEYFVENGDNLFNPTGFDSEPLIYFSAIDSGTIQIGNYSITVLSTLPAYAVMDCETWTVYQDGGTIGYGYNQYISLSEFPKLQPGDNIISWTGGVTIKKIVPRWRTL